MRRRIVRKEIRMAFGFSPGWRNRFFQAIQELGRTRIGSRMARPSANDHAHWWIG